MLIQLIHGLDVGIGLACARLHLYGEVDTLTFEAVDGFESLPYLQGTHILCDVTALERQWGIAEALHHLVLKQALVVLLFFLVFDVDRPIMKGLPLERSHHITCSFSLEVLMLEFQFHACSVF